MTNFSKKSWLNRNLLGFSCASFFSDFSFEMVTAILPTFTTLLVGPQLAPYVLGVSLGFSEAASSAMKLFSGWLTDRITRHKFLLIIGYGVTPVCVALLGTAHYAWQLIAYRFIAFMGRGLREPPRDAWLAAVTEPKDYGKAFGFQRACDTLGALAGPVLVFFIIAHVPLTSLFFIASIPGILSVLSILFLTHETGRAQPHYANTPAFTQFKALPTPLIYFLMSRFIFGLGYFHVTLIILRAQELLGGWAIGLYILFNCIRATSEYGMGALSDYIDRKNLLAYGGFGLFSITCLLLAYADGSVWWWMLIFFTAGISIATVTALEKAYTGDLLPTTLHGTGYGALEATKGLGLLTSNLIVGTLWSNGYACQAFMYAAYASALAMILLTIKPPAKTN